MSITKKYTWGGPAWSLVQRDGKEVRVLVAEALPQIRDGRIEYPVVLTTSDVPKFEEVEVVMAKLRTGGLAMNSPSSSEAIAWIAALDDPEMCQKMEGMGAGIQHLFQTVGAQLAHNSFMFAGYARGPWEVNLDCKSRKISLGVSNDQIGRWIGRGGCHIKAVRKILVEFGWHIDLHPIK